MATVWPPSGPTGLTKVIPSVAYKEYDDDESINAFVFAFNQLAQNYVDTLNDLNLPIYTQAIISGALLDWVAQGIYGMARPPLSSQKFKLLGPLNTAPLNTIAFNSYKNLSQTAVVATTDDFFKRILTWHLYKGDGKVFNVRWLKRRIMRFLTGTNGTSPNIDQTYQVSVTFGTGNNVSIRLLHGRRTFKSGALFNTFVINGMPFNRFNTNYVPYAPLANADIFQEAAATGALELPFQFHYTITV